VKLRQVDVAKTDAADTLRSLPKGKGGMSSAKNNVESFIRKLPEDCTLEDFQYHLYVLEKI
jgi:hypothetical protein